MSDDLESQLGLLQALTGTWTTEGTHPLLPGEVIRGSATFEWLDGHRFLIWRSSYEHPQIPDAIAITGIIDDELVTQYFDVRGVHRVYSVEMRPGTWRYWRDDAGFSQRFTGTFSDDGDRITGAGQFSRDGETWENDLALTYRRTG